jgi:hypothetical protein
MSNISKDHPSIRLHAPPGGHSNNIFGTSEFEQSAANKKKQLGSDIFGSNSTEPTPVAKQNRDKGNNIFGTDPQETNTKGGTIAGQFKQTQMKSNIFGTDEPTTTRHVSDKNKSNIFGIGDSEHPSAPKHSHRVGYNPINGESYTPKENVNSNGKQPDTAVKTSEAENGTAQVESTDKAQEATATKANEHDKVEKPDSGNDAQKNVHTSVRVFHPPGGKSNGPLW